MHRNVRIVVRAGVLSLVVAPCVAWADVLPPDSNDVYYHCTPAEQCPQVSETCDANSLGAGRRSPEPACAARATEHKLEQRCLGRSGYLYCPPGTTGSWKAKPPSAAPSEAPRRGCS